MSVQFLGPDPLDDEINRVLEAVAERAAGRGTGPIERHRVDLKEEAGRRDARGRIGPSAPRSEPAAKALLHEAACMANTPGGGALVIGVADDGTLIGTELEAEWLRHRLYELSGRTLTVDARVALVNNVRVLVLRMAEAIELVRVNNRVYWRVDDHCVEVDPTTAIRRRTVWQAFDWSAQASTHAAQDAHPVALQHARDYLRSSGDAAADELARATNEDLLRRLNAVTPEGMLTNAAALTFIGRGPAALDYMRRDHAGGDSRRRVNAPDRALLTELAEVELAANAFNPNVHFGDGFAVGQIGELPANVIREAIVNGLAHRDWATPAATVVEHIAAHLTVTSPGGFVGGVAPSNIITHPSQSRNTALTALLAALKVAERQGVGVDRMVATMIRYGYPLPQILEIEGPYVRTVLLGGRPDLEWLGFLLDLTPDEITADVDALLLLHHLAERGWVDAASAAPLLQRSEPETAAAIDRLAAARSTGIKPDRTRVEPSVIVPVDGTPTDAPAAWRFSADTRRQLVQRLKPLDAPAGRRRIALDWARNRGRISSTELSSLTGVVVNFAGRILKDLEADGELVPGRETRTGRGFFYRPAP